MAFTRTLRNVLTMIVAFGLLVAAVWFVAGHQARAASSTPVVYVATGENFPDALGAGPVAAMVKGPVLLVRFNSIPSQTATELTRLGPDKIVIVGGTGVISTAVENSLKAFAGTVERIAGTDRYDTAAKLSAATYPASFDADTLDGKDSTEFLGKTEKAADSDKLDGLDATDLVLVSGKATDTAINDFTTSTFTAILTDNVTAPVAGFLHITAYVYASDDTSLSGKGWLFVNLRINGTLAGSTGVSRYFPDCSSSDNVCGEDAIPFTIVTPVAAGAHTIELVARDNDSGTFIYGSSVSTLFVAFGNGVSIPFSATEDLPQSQSELTGR